MSMNMTEIDRVIADDLQAGDVIKVGATHLEVIERLPDDGDVIVVRTDDDEPVEFQWDAMVTLYGEGDEE